MKNIRLSVFFCPLMMMFLQESIVEEKHLAIVVPSFNNVEWYKKNLDSIFMQDYSNYTVYYLDDCSNDGTSDLVKAYAQKKGYLYKMVIRSFDERAGKLKHMYELFHELNDWTIIVQIDGDDWLPDGKTDIFQKINQVYSNQNIWITYGQCQGWHSHQKSARRVHERMIAERLFGKWWPYAHLHTFYAWLFKAINKQDLCCQTIDACKGQWYFFADDVAFMTPMIEMARYHYHYFDEVLYVYNDKPKQHSQPYFVGQDTSRLIVQEILNKPSYKPLPDNYTAFMS